LSAKAVRLRRSTGGSVPLPGKTQLRQESPMADVHLMTAPTLISAATVNGTSVYGRDGDRLGSIEDIMIDKVSGRAVYAVLAFGGFLGMGTRFHPLPWSTLKYDLDRNGYVIDLDKDRLAAAPSHARDEALSWTPEYGRSVDTYYGAPGNWL
jgi:PRC-barrel domain